MVARGDGVTRKAARGDSYQCTAQSVCGGDDGSVVSAGSCVFEEPEEKTDT